MEHWFFKGVQFLPATAFFKNSFANKLWNWNLSKQSFQTNDFSIWFIVDNAFIRVKSVLIRGFKKLVAAKGRAVGTYG